MMRLPDGDVGDSRLRELVRRRCVSLWIRWVLANSVGGTLGWILGQILASQIGSLLSAPVGLLLLPVVQSVVLRRYFRQSSWIFVSSLGQLFGFFTWTLVNSSLGIAAVVAIVGPSEGFELLGVLVDTRLFWEWVLALFVIWGVVGIAQRGVMRRRVEHAGWWVVGCSLAGALSGVAMVVALSSTDDQLLSSAIRWTVYGTLTGLVLLPLLQSVIRRRLARELQRQ